MEVKVYREGYVEKHIFGICLCCGKNYGLLIDSSITPTVKVFHYCCFGETHRSPCIDHSKENTPEMLEKCKLLRKHKECVLDDTINDLESSQKEEAQYIYDRLVEAILEDGEVGLVCISSSVIRHLLDLLANDIFYFTNLKDLGNGMTYMSLYINRDNYFRKKEEKKE